MRAPLRGRARVPRRGRRRLHDRADARPGPRLLLADHLRVHRARDAGHRLRRRDRAAPDPARGGEDRRRATPDRRLLRARRRRRQAARAGPRRRAQARRTGRGHGLRRSLAEGPADAGRTARRGHDRDRARRPGNRPPPRRAGRRRRLRPSRGDAVSHYRDVYCGSPRAQDVGKRLQLAGWAAKRRDHGGLIFIDLRDHTGIVQLVVNPENAADAARVAHEVRREFVLHAEGEIVPRAPENVNPGLPTGKVELRVERLSILSRSEPLPFQLDDEGVDEPLRLRYRWLDLRRERMQRNLRLSATVVSAIRRRMEELGFVDLWTPGLIRTSPEGARDFVVPVRLQPGRFFALAQSPQLFKQLFMIGGFDRYYQIATCWRDEDLRADRQFEFRQLDIELAFPERDDVLEVLEEAVTASFEALGREPPSRPFPRRSWHDVMARYGSDKPDLRFDMEIQDATEATRDSQFGVFASAPAVRFVTVPQAFSRGELDRLERDARQLGAKGLAYLVYDEEGEVRSPIVKFLSETELEQFRADPGSTVLFAADERR